VAFIAWRCGSTEKSNWSPVPSLSGEDLLLDTQRVYADYRIMAAEESRLPSGERIDFVSVVTPNRTHVPVAKTFLEAGIKVVCDKPLAFNLEEARALRDVVRKTGKLFAFTGCRLQLNRHRLFTMVKLFHSWAYGFSFLVSVNCKSLFAGSLLGSSTCYPESAVFGSKKWLVMPC
jgi:hypothetical protein